MAPGKKSSGASKAGSAAKTKTEPKDVSVDDMKDDELIALEKEGSYAWKILQKSQIQYFKTLAADDLMVAMAEKMEVNDWQSDWRMGALLDCHVLAFVWALQQAFDNRQISAFFTLNNEIIKQIKDGQSLFSVSNFLADVFAAPVSEPHAEGKVEDALTTASPVECLTPDQVKTASEFITNTILQHFSLYDFIFTSEQVEEVTSVEYCISVLPEHNVPFPAPLEEALTEEVYNQCILTPEPTPEPVEAEQPVESDPEIENDPLMETTEKEDEILAELTVDQIRNVVNKLAARQIGSFQEEYHNKLKERESAYLQKITKLAKNVEI